MGKPRSVFNSAVDTNRKIAKNFGQFRQNITGMSSTFRGMPANPPKVSSGETNKVGGDTEKTKVQYLESLRIDKSTRIDFSTVGGSAGITSTVASGQFIDFKIGATSLLNIGPTNVTFKNTVLAPAIDFGSLSSRLGNIFATDLDLSGELNADGDVVLGSGGTGETIQIIGNFSTELRINGQDIILDVDRDTKIFSSSDDVIKINTHGVKRVEINDSGVGITNDLQVSGEFELVSSSVPTSTLTSITSFIGAMHYNATSGDSHFFKVNGTTEVEIDADGLDIRNGWLELEERTAPSGLGNHARLYAKDNGAGKTQLVVIFGSGVEQVIATQP
jgi:hypothetical protein